MSKPHLTQGDLLLSKHRQFHSNSIFINYTEGCNIVCIYMPVRVLDRIGFELVSGVVISGIYKAERNILTIHYTSQPMKAFRFSCKRGKHHL